MTTPHDVDSYLQAINPLWSVDQVRAVVVHKQSQTKDTISLQLRPNRNWQGGQAGQFVRLSIDIDGRLHSRCFSPAQSEHASNGLIEITAKLPPDAFVTRHLRDHLLPGDVVRLSQAAGNFSLPAKRPGRIALISGGSGITPVMAMLRTLCDENHSGQITFIHYNRSAEDQLYASELDALAARHKNLKLLRCYENDATGEFSGRFRLDQLTATVRNLPDTQIFLCGPGGLMNAVEQGLATLGCKNNLHKEAFSLASAPSERSATREGELRFARSERRALSTGASLLEQAEAAGLSPEAGCRMGICYSCTCRKTSGRVRDMRTGQLSDNGPQDIQLCVNTPVGDVTLDL